jgi:hypothetical protein
VSLTFEGLEQFGDTFVRAREVAVVRIVIGHKVFTQAQYGSFITMLLWQGTLDKAIDTITYQSRVIRYLVRRKTASRQGMVACLPQIINRIDECTV